MSSYDNGKGILITNKNDDEYILIKIYDNLSFYEPFIRIISKCDMIEKSLYKINSLKFEQIIRFSQVCKPISIRKPITTFKSVVHHIDPKELISLLYLIPTQIGCTMVTNLYKIFNQTIGSWNSSLINSLHSMVFSGFLVSYLKKRSGFKETDSIYSVPKWDTLVWNNGKFSVLDQSSCG